MKSENNQTKAEVDSLNELVKEAMKILQYVADAEPSDFKDSWARQWIDEIQINRIDPLLERYEDITKKRSKRVIEDKRLKTKTENKKEAPLLEPPSLHCSQEEHDCDERKCPSDDCDDSQD